MLTVSALVFGSLWFVADNRYIPRSEVNERFIQTVEADHRYVQQEALYGALKELENDRDKRDLENQIERLEAKAQLTPKAFTDYDAYELESAKRKLGNMHE